MYLQYSKNSVIGLTLEGSGQLEEFMNPSKIIGCEVQREACEAISKNFSNVDVSCCSFFNYFSDVVCDCVVMNPPFSLKFKDLSIEEQDNIQKDFDWKKSGVVDDIFILKSMQFTKRYAFHICFPGISYRKQEEKMRKLIGNNLLECNSVLNAFNDTDISVLFLVIDKEKTTEEVHKEIFDCKNSEIVYSYVEQSGDDKWSIPREPIKSETIDIDIISKEANEHFLKYITSRMELNYFLAYTLNAPIDFPILLDGCYKILDKYKMRLKNEFHNR